MTDVWELGLVQGLEKLGDGSLSASDWVRSLADRRAACESAVGAWALFDHAGALARAEQVDASLAEEESPGALAGAPIAVKDLIDVAGLPREAGSPLFAGHVPERDASAVARLRAAGAVILGKTVTCELGTNQPSPTRNPWNPAHSPGASSSGSAAAVATGMAPAALGTQTGGSVIRPAAYCGVVGCKPTFGRIARDGVVALSWSVDHLGVFARSVTDIRVLLAIVCGPSEADDATLEASAADLEAPIEPRRPVRICVLYDDFLPHASEEIADWMVRAAARLRAAGVQVEDRRLPVELDEVHSFHRVVVRAEAAAYHQDRFQETPAAFGPDIRNNILSGLMVPAAHYLKALRLKARFTRRMDELCRAYDLVITPATRDTAPLAEESTGDPLFNEPFSVSGLPALTLPLGRGDAGLPVGIQLAGPRLGEAKLLAAARWCEAELGWRAEIARPGPVIGETA